jgi:hypothetical protein
MECVKVFNDRLLGVFVLIFQILTIAITITEQIITICFFIVYFFNKILKRILCINLSKQETRSFQQFKSLSLSLFVLFIFKKNHSYNTLSPVTEKSFSPLFALWTRSKTNDNGHNKISYLYYHKKDKKVLLPGHQNGTIDIYHFIQVAI